LSVLDRLQIQDVAPRSAIERLLRLVGRMRPVMEAIGAYMESQTRLRFERGEAPGGEPWKPSIRAQLEGGQTLLKSGRLRSSITYVAGEDQVEIGTNVVYAAMHQLGGTVTAKSAPFLMFKVGGRFVRKTSVTIPARPFLGVDDDNRAEIHGVLGGYLGRAA